MISLFVALSCMNEHTQTIRLDDKSLSVPYKYSGWGHTCNCTLGAMGPLFSHSERGKSIAREQLIHIVLLPFKEYTWKSFFPNYSFDREDIVSLSKKEHLKSKCL